MNKLSKKEIKECKNNIYNHGVDYYGWWHGILTVISEIDIELMLEITEELIEYGYSRLKDESSFDSALITEFSKRIGYQDFKKLVPWLLGFYGVKYENGELIQY